MDIICRTDVYGAHYTYLAYTSEVLQCCTTVCVFKIESLETYSKLMGCFCILGENVLIDALSSLAVKT